MRPQTVKMKRTPTEVSFLRYDIVRQLQAAAKDGSKFGVGRTRALLDALSSPDKKLKIVHIAGSNGKGSTAAYISHALKVAGKKVGTFTSPAVYSYEEQFCIDCFPMDREIISEYLGAAKKAAEKFADEPTAFETETAAALYAFYKEGCEYAVVECGLGGRDDATNAVSRKSVAVITSIGLEHMAVLGCTLTDICAAKSGIINNCPAVVSALQEKETIDFFKDRSVIFAGGGLKILSATANGQVFEYDGGVYKISMHGSAQCYNAATAIETCKILGLDVSDIKRGLAETVLAGRCEIIKKRDTVYILDGAHNPSAFPSLLETLKLMPEPKRLIFGCLSDKDVKEVARVLGNSFGTAVLLSPDSYRAMDSDKMAGAFQGEIDDIKTARSVSGALECTGGGTVVVCGSFTLLKEAKEWIEKRQ